jgi:hypothetical protein
MEQPRYSVDEADGTVEVCVVLEGMLEIDVAIDFFTEDISATGISNVKISGVDPFMTIFSLASLDYVPTSDTLIFLADEFTSRRIWRNISVIPDEVVENTETLSVSVDTFESNVIISRLNATVTLLDNSGKAMSAVKLNNVNMVGKF